jgi:hypothetical protein
LIVEGALHTKNLKLYILRIGIMASIISTFLLVFQYTDLFGVVSTANVTNIFFQFILCLSAIFFLNLRKWKKLLALIPLAEIPVVHVEPPSLERYRPPLTIRSISEGEDKLVEVIPYSSIITL